LFSIVVVEVYSTKSKKKTKIVIIIEVYSKKFQKKTAKKGEI
jgi:hypothetical protein